jgi:hypothetical protein
MIPYLIALVGGYFIGEGMGTDSFAKGGILDSNVKDNVSDYLIHRLDNADFEVYIDNSVSPAELTVTCTSYDNIDIQNFLKDANQALFDGEGKEEYSSVKGPLPEFLLQVMADGGKTATFQDKVNAVASRLIDTDVPKKLQKDYGKKYNKEEAYLAAKRIIGSQMSKEMADGGDIMAKGGVTSKPKWNLKPDPKYLRKTDWEDLAFVKEMYDEGNYEAAINFASNLDTIVRDEIPPEVWQKLGGSLTKKGLEEAKQNIKKYKKA